MSDQPKPSPEPADADDSLSVGPDPTATRFLTPDMCRIHIGSHGALHVTVTNERIYGGVFAAYAFPVAHGEEYISLLHVTSDKEIEIGLIHKLADFPDDQVDLVRQALRRRYFIHTIQGIRSIGMKYGMLVLDAETDKGPVNITMRWQQDRAVDYGKRGKVLVDIHDNRYLIPDVDELPPRERKAFLRYVYW